MNFLDLKLHKFFPWFWYSTLCAGWKGKLLSVELQRGKISQIPYYLYSQLSQIIIHKSPSLSWTAHGLQGQERGGAFIARTKPFRNLKFLKKWKQWKLPCQAEKTQLLQRPTRIELIYQTVGGCFHNREHRLLICEKFSGTIFIVKLRLTLGTKRQKFDKSIERLEVFEKKIYSGSPDTRLGLVKLWTC